MSYLSYEFLFRVEKESVFFFFFRILQYRDKFNRQLIFYVIINLRMGSFL